MRQYLKSLLESLAERSFHWRTLLTVLDAGIFSRLYLWLLIVPWLVQFTDKFPTTLDLKPFDANPLLTISLTLPFTWYILYFSGVSFLLARVTFIYFCPRFLRDYENAGDASSKGLTIQYVMNEARDFLVHYYHRPANITDAEFSRLRDILQQYRIDDTKIFVMKECNSAIGGELRERLEGVILQESQKSPSYYVIGDYPSSLTIEKEQLFKHSFWGLNRFQDASFPKARLISTLFAAVGAGLFCFVAVEGFVYVFRHIL